MAEQHNYSDDLDPAAMAVKVSNAMRQMRRIPFLGSAAVKLVRMCACLALESIPDELFTQGNVRFSNWLIRLLYGEPSFAKVYNIACEYGLLLRETDPPGLRMHPLTQRILRDSLSKVNRKRMAECVVRAVSEAFPWVSCKAWPLCERLLPHALFGRQVCRHV